MKKFVLTVAVIISTAAICNAQGGKKLQLSIGPEVGITTGDFSQTHSFGIGANVTGEYAFDPTFSGTIASGFDIYSGKSAGTNVKYKAITIIPVRAGIRYYLGPTFYSAAELGVGIISGSGSTSAFGYSLGLGTKFHTGSKFLDLGIKYDAYSRSGTLGAIVFKLALVL